MRRVLAALGFAGFLLGAPMQAGTATAATPRFLWGQCVWWAAQVRPDIGALVWGNAANWDQAAQQAGRYHFAVDEMNFPLLGVVTQLVSHIGAGVTFIY